MTFQIRTIICTVAALTILLATSCADDDAPRATVQMPVSLVLPAEAIETRAFPGDPGTWEKFNEPEYLYLFIVLQDEDNKVSLRSEQQRLTKEWEKIVQGTDSAYRYTGNIQVSFPHTGRKAGAVYATVSYTALTLDWTGWNDWTNYNNWNEAVEAIKSITFTLNDDNNLQDIYSSPYNLTATIEEKNQYYGTIEEVNSAVPHVDNLMLFHVAAKVDLIWNVADNVQPDIRLTGITVNGLSRKGYLFCPNENTTPDETDKYTHPIPINIGNQWDGRAYFYAIPYSDGTNYPITIDLKANGKTDKTGVALNIPYTTSTENPYTHWMRGDIRINSWN